MPWFHCGWVTHWLGLASAHASFAPSSTPRLRCMACVRSKFARSHNVEMRIARGSRRCRPRHRNFSDQAICRRTYVTCFVLWYGRGCVVHHASSLTRGVPRHMQCAHHAIARGLATSECACLSTLARALARTSCSNGAAFLNVILSRRTLHCL